jgi:hypothetical protein
MSHVVYTTYTYFLLQNIEGVDQIDVSLDGNPADPHETTVPYVGVGVSVWHTF